MEERVLPAVLQTSFSCFCCCDRRYRRTVSRWSDFKDDAPLQYQLQTQGAALSSHGEKQLAGSHVGLELPLLVDSGYSNPSSRSLTLFMTIKGQDDI